MSTAKQREFDENIKKLLEGIKPTQLEINNTIEYIQSNYNVPIQRVCCYGRVSTKHEEQESSLQTQHVLFNQYCESHRQNGYVLVEEIYDQKTATLAIKRKKFMDMIERAKSGEFNVLLFKDSKRMCRNTEEFLHMTEELARLNIACVFISDSVNSLTADRTTLTVLGMVAESHSNGLHTSVSIAKQINMQREKGKVPSYCFGYDKPIVNDSTVMIINQTEAELVRELFSRYVYNNEGVSTIASDWRARGIKSKLGNNVSTTMLNKMLDNKIYIGVLEMGLSYKHDVRDNRTYNAEPTIIRERPDLRIIDDDIFNLAQDKRKALSFGKGHMQGINRKTALSGKIVCSKCGKSFKRFRNGVGDKRTIYYKCSTVKAGKRNAVTCDCDNGSYFRRDEIMDSLTVYFKQMLENQDDIKGLIKKSVASFFSELEENTDDKSLLAEIEQAQKEFKRHQELYLEGLLDDMSLVKEKKKALDDLVKKQALLSKKTLIDFDVDSIADSLFENIEGLISNGLNGLDTASEKSVVLFNSLFDSIIATNDNKLVFNIGLDSVNKISTLANTYRNGYNLKGVRSNNISDTSIKLLSEEQLQVLEEMNNTLVFISLNNIFDNNYIFNSMNEIRTATERNRRMYRYSERYRNLGNTLIDSVNIVL